MSRVYNRIYTDEEYSHINIENKDIVQDFLEEYQQRKMKASTIKQYENDLRIINIFIKRFCGNRNLLELGKKDFRKLSIWMSDDLKMSNARVNRVMSSCRSMLSYIEDSDEYEYDINQAQKIKGLPKEPVRTDEDSFFMTFDQIIRVKEKLLEMGEIQLALLHMIMFDSGARRNEIAQIKKHNLLNGNKTNIVVGKRGKIFPLVYLDDTKELIRLWLDKRGEDNVESLWIVGSGDKKREASYEMIYDWVLKIREILSEIEGKQMNIFPHSYRHSRCECLLQGEDKRILDKDGIPKKFSLEQVQVYLHHSDPKTTLDYSKDHTDEIIDKMFGL